MEPFPSGVVIELFRPQKPCDRLSHDILSIQRKVIRDHLLVEFIGFLFSPQEDLIEIGIECIGVAVKGAICEPQLDADALPRSDLKLIVTGGFGTRLLRIHSRAIAVDHKIINAVLHISGGVVDTE